MITIDSRIYVYNFNSKEFEAAMREAIGKLLVQAGRKFLLAAAPNIPVFTGFARSTLRNLEDVVGQVGREGTGWRIRTTRTGSNVAKRLQRKRYWYYPPGGAARVERNTNNGRRFATRGKDNILKGGTTASGRSSIYFVYKVDVTYVTKLDKAKWLAFKRGSEAFREHVRANIGKVVPSPAKFTTRHTYKA